MLVFSACFWPGMAGGGPIRSVIGIVDTADSSLAVRVLTADRDIGTQAPYDGLANRTVKRGDATVTYVNPRSLQGWRSMVRVVRNTNYDLVYLNSFFSPAFTLLPLMMTLLRILRCERVLIAPRGEFSPGALKLKCFRKYAYLTTFRTYSRFIPITWHASGAMEAAAIRAVIPSAVVVECEDPTSLQGMGPLPPLDDHSPPSFVFVSRISPKKNLLNVVLALSRVDPPIILDIYGPLEDGKYWRKCLDAIKEVPQRHVVTYQGTLAPDDVVDRLRSYDAFVFPTLGENFGHVIAESLAASCPVICTAHTPWTEIIKSGGGLITSEDPQGIAEAMTTIASATVSQRTERRLEAGRAFGRWMTLRSHDNILDMLLIDGKGLPSG